MTTREIVCHRSRKKTQRPFLAYMRGIQTRLCTAGEEESRPGLGYPEDIEPANKNVQLLNPSLSAHSDITRPVVQWGQPSRAQ
jgi:hypothetical protein